MICYSATAIERAPCSINTEGPSTDTTNDLNFATGTRRTKAVTTQIAQLVIAGHAVHELTNGGYLVCKYGYTYHACDFETLQDFARKLGVSK
jgi:hypothetical protein